MAILGTDEDPNNPNGKGTQPASQTGGTGANVTSGGSGFISGGTGQGATTSVNAAGASPAGTSSGRFTNLSSYLDANQGAGATNGKAVENVVDQAGKSADSALGSYTGDTSSAIKSGTANLDQGVVSQIQGGAKNIDQGVLGGIASGVNKNTWTDKTNGADLVGAANGGYSGPDKIDASYKGPGDLGSLSGQAAADKKQAYGAIQSLVGQKGANGQYQGGLVGQAGGGQAGVASLLRNTYTQPSYTAGENGLDAFLTGGTTGGQAALSKIKSDWGGEGGKLDSAESGLTSAIGDAKTTSANTQATYDADIYGSKLTSQATQGTYQDAIDKAQKQASSYVAPQAPAPAPAPAAGAAPSSGPVQSASPMNSSSAGHGLDAGSPIVAPTSTAAPSAFQGIVNAVGNQTKGTPVGQAAGEAKNAFNNSPVGKAFSGRWG